MKRLLSVALGTALALALAVVPARAAAGDVIGTVCWSDITAKIDGRTIPSYNWEGTTVVPAELLRYYGMQIAYNQNQRELRISWKPDGERSGTYTPPEDWPAAGTPAYDILETDIVTYVQGKPVQGLNVGGTTMVRLSDLASCGTVTWNPANSVAELTLFEDLPSLERDRVIAELEAQAEALGGSCAYEVQEISDGTPRRNKTVVIGRITLPDGTVQGSMTCIYGNGRVLDMADLLPEEIVARLAPRIREMNTFEISIYTPTAHGEDDEHYEDHRGRHTDSGAVSGSRGRPMCSRSSPWTSPWSNGRRSCGPRRRWAAAPSVRRCSTGTMTRWWESGSRRRTKPALPWTRTGGSPST